MEKRDWKIYFEWINGKNYNELASEFGLAHSTIKKICHRHLPPAVLHAPGLRESAYKKYREWLKNKRQGSQI